MTIEYYPITVSYADAEVGPTGGTLKNGYGMEYIHGMYRIGDGTFLEVALQYASYPSFCGGAYAHSPISRIISESSWGGMLGNGYKRNCEHASDFGPEVIDLREHVQCEGWERDDWKRYGYRALANGMFNRMTEFGKRGVMLSGPTHGEVANFIEEIPKVGWYRSGQVQFGKAAWDQEGYLGTLVTRECPIQAVVQPTDSFVNYNSHNDCHWYPVVITSDLLGGEEGRNDEDESRDRAYEDYVDSGAEEDYCFDDWYDEHYSEYQGGEDVIEKNRPQIEMDYAKVCGDYIRRFTWSN
jgi:hypothetical protein